MSHEMIKKVSYTLPVILAACFVAGTGKLTLNVMPINLGGATDAFSLTPQQTGNLGSVILIGFLLGNLITVAIEHRLKERLNRKIGITLGSLVAASGMGMSVYIESLNLLYIMWSLFGFGAAVIWTISLEVIAAAENKERSMGLMNAMGILWSAVLLYIFPTFLIKDYGFNGVGFGMFAVMLIPIFLLWLTPSRVDKSNHHAHASSEHGQGSNAMGWLALFSVFLFIAAFTGLWAFLERIAKEIGISNESIGFTFSVLKLLGGLACFVPVIIGSRFGLRWPYVAGIAGTGIGLYLMYMATGQVAFAAGAWTWEIGLVLIFNYILAGVSRADRTGRCVSLIPAAYGAGGVVGPAFAGWLKTISGDFLMVFVIHAICILCIGLFFIFVANQGRGQARQPAFSEA